MLNSSAHQPFTMLIAPRPALMRSRLAPNFAASCGSTMPGCTAGMISMVLVWAASAEPSIQASRSGPR
jgi:hypothetical protein